MDLTEKTLERGVLFQGAIVTLRRDRAQLPDGREAFREVVEHPGGVAILPLHPDNTVTLVRQYRYPFAQVMTELPAGKLDRGEDHRVCALRELEEETGLVPGDLTYLGYLRLSPGYSNEVLHLYLARDLRQGESHPDEGEFLNVLRVPFDQLLDQVMDGTLTDAKTVAGVLKTWALLRRQEEVAP